MDRQRLAHALEDLAHDVDLALFDLEQARRAPVDGAAAEDAALRLQRRVERWRERLLELAERAVAG